MAKKPIVKHPPRFKDSKGKEVNPKYRYSSKVKSVEAWRGRRYVKIMRRTPTPDALVDLLNRTEFENLPEATKKIKSYTSTAKYKAWDVAGQIDKTKGIRRKDLKVTMEIIDGKRKKKVSFYHKIRRNTQSSYSIFRRINQEVGLEGAYLYRTAGEKHLADRKGKKVKLGKVTVEQVI